MSDLIERYIHQVGRYLPRRERTEIEAELRSLIQDKLEHRYAGTPSRAEVASVLAELGDPRQMAVSYGSQQYLVGPELYPVMMAVLRVGWLTIPALVIVLDVIGKLTSVQQTAWLTLLVEPLLAAAQAAFMFSAVVVLIFAILQHTRVDLTEIREAFDPLALPEVDNPVTVDRFETIFGIAIAASVTLVLLYFLAVGGLTLRINPTDPADVIPVPVPWLLVLLGLVIAMLVLNVIVLRRGRWNLLLWLTESVLELGAAVSLYFAIWQPLFAHLVRTNPAIAEVPFITNGAEIIAISTALIMLVNNASKLVKLWMYRSSSTTFSVRGDA